MFSSISFCIISKSFHDLGLFKSINYLSTVATWWQNCHIAIGGQNWFIMIIDKDIKYRAITTHHSTSRDYFQKIVGRVVQSDLFQHIFQSATIVVQSGSFKSLFCPPLLLSFNINHDNLFHAQFFILSDLNMQQYWPKVI